jgi:[methyl-Co(III) methanol-specific corrinoid protein]:coenzyme M methyltransferase
LREGWIAGAGLDVFEPERLPPEHPLLQSPKVIATPHVAFYSEESLVDLEVLAAENVAAILSGYRPKWVVNPEVLDLPRWSHLKQERSANRLFAPRNNDMELPYEMTSKRRFLSSLMGGRVDRPAVASATSVTNVDQQKMLGTFLPDAHLDGKLMARLAAGAHSILGYDAIMPYFSVHAESSALGAEVDWGDKENMPTDRTSPWTDPEEVTIPPDFLEKPATKAVIDAIRILRYEYGHQVAIMGKVMGPWTLSYHMHGVQDFLIETILDPDRVRGFLDRLQEVSVLFARAQIQAGADIVCLADHLTGDLASPETYRDFLLAYHKKLTLRIGCPMVLHICGNTLDRLGYISESGFDCFHLDSKVDAKDALMAVDGRMSIMGNINNPEVLLQGTTEQVAECTRYAMEAGIQILGPECAIPLVTPTENLKEIMRVSTGQQQG